MRKTGLAATGARIELAGRRCGRVARRRGRCGSARVPRRASLRRGRRGGAGSGADNGKGIVYRHFAQLRELGKAA